MTKRCEWGLNHQISIDYHDKEWGVPVHDDKVLFEFLILEGAQAGLSWITILNRRENYREAFNAFDYEKIAKYNEKKSAELLQNVGIIRNKLKIRSTVTNAQAFIEVRKEFGTFDKYIWSFVDYKPIQNEWKTLRELPAKTELSETISKDLKKRGFRFVGPTIVYAFMQAVGMVNDHTTDCFRYKELKKH
ncbi:MAG: DNA-3-methyladenine glycosylase I [Candidatus Heimdallarchaeota archaeon]|nr:DNA-3-methyladenine glycosylase I [Candidatus Heimdallarchaeota archaeon]MBY8995010.1 DNA-3-methyladenine glycosylase I [Candidatus Heimdallarchaeota archaeon]